jgi:hypothetical protein
MVMVAALPLVVYGWISVREGWLAVPADVYFRRAPLVPDGLAGLLPILLRPLDILNLNAALRAMTLAPFIAVFWRAMIRKQDAAFAQPLLRTLLFGGTLLLHLYLVGAREYRYDAYLFLLGWAACLPWLQELFEYFQSEKISVFSVPSAAFGMLGLILLFPLANRGVSETLGWWDARESFRLNQNAAVSYCLKQNPQTGIATDFPGVFAYAGFSVVDLTGMGSLDLSRARGSGGIQKETIAREISSRPVLLAAVWNPSVREYLPADWIHERSVGPGNDIYLYEIPAH